MRELLAHESVDENLRFLILEVGKQLERTREYMRTRSPKLLESILERDDYIDNLKSLIHRKVLSYAARANGGKEAGLHLLNSAEVVTANLERIADFCENVVNQLGYIDHPSVLERLDVDAFFGETLQALQLVEHALFDHDVESAITICRAEARLDEHYVRVRQLLLDDLKRGADAPSTVTAIFIAHYFERMGDSLLNIGEAILSACLGESIKIDHFEALRDSLEAADIEASPGSVGFQAIVGTRSGHRIARVSHRREGDANRMVIFKEGRSRKLKEEVESIRLWEQVVPGLAPKVYSFLEKGDVGAILFEYLPGATFEQLLIAGTEDDVDSAVARICDTLEGVWRLTRKPEAVSPHFLAQLKKRLDDLYVVHPEFRNHGGQLGSARVSSLDDLVRDAAPLDDLLTAPFSVFVHGDFNVDNVIYDGVEDRARFIDLHRSRQMDYVQDISVFIVSSLRLQALKAHVRRRIRRAVTRIYLFAEAFARRADDRTFEARLGLGLARSFATSTRFVLDPTLSRTLMRKARYLLERLVDAGPANVAAFRVPQEVLFD